MWRLASGGKARQRRTLQRSSAAQLPAQHRPAHTAHRVRRSVVVHGRRRVRSSAARGSARALRLLRRRPVGSSSSSRARLLDGRSHGRDLLVGGVLIHLRQPGVLLRLLLGRLRWRRSVRRCLQLGRLPRLRLRLGHARRLSRSLIKLLLLSLQLRDAQQHRRVDVRLARAHGTHALVALAPAQAHADAAQAAQARRLRCSRCGGVRASALHASKHAHAGVEGGVPSARAWWHAVAPRSRSRRARSARAESHPAGRARCHRSRCPS